MNRKQRDQNRANAEKLRPRPICPECGDLGPHFVPPNDFFPDGFWICKKFYGENGRRLEP